MKFTTQLLQITLKLNICIVLLTVIENSYSAEFQKNIRYSHHEYVYTSFMSSLPVPYCQPSDPIRYPKSQEEVVKIIQEAILLGKTVKPIGAVHSITDLICTDGIPISMVYITGIQLNSDNTVTVGGGNTIQSVCEYLERHGRALQSIPAFGNITVAGAIGTGAHGSSIKHPSTISETVIEFLIVDGLGKIRRINKEEDLKAFRLNLGLLGVILEVTLPTVEFYKVKAHNIAYPEEILTNGTIFELLKTTDQVEAYWFPTYGRAIISSVNFINASTPGDAWTNNHVPDVSSNAAFIQKRYFEIAQMQNSTQLLRLFEAGTGMQLTRKLSGYPLIYTEDGENVRNPAVGSYYKMIGTICHETGNYQCQWLHGEDGFKFLTQEFSIDLQRIREFIPIVKDILNKSPAVFPMQGILFRFSGKKDIHLATSRRGPICTIEFLIVMRDDPYNTASTGLAAFQATAQTLLHKFNAQPHWGKTGAFYHSSETLHKTLNPLAREAFLRKMNEFDPNGLFLNAYGRRLKGSDTKFDLDPKVKHCALLESCVCSTNDDCAPGQECSRIKDYPDYPVCKYPGNETIPPVLNAITLSRYLLPLLDRLSGRG